MTGMDTSCTWHHGKTPATDLLTDVFVAHENAETRCVEARRAKARPHAPHSARPLLYPQGMDNTFRGDKKVGESWVGRWERRFVEHHLDRIPRWLETYHLTSMTVFWSAAVIVCGALATSHRGWLLGSCAAIAGQYLSDLFDGAIGRRRGTGLVRWGFYADHLLDALFLASLWVGYGLFLPAQAAPWLLAAAGLTSTLMAHSFLAFAAQGEFRISYGGVGPTEVRAAFIALNIALVVFGGTFFVHALPWLCGALLVTLLALSWRTGRELWRADMLAKGVAAKRDPASPAGARGVCSA